VRKVQLKVRGKCGGRKHNNQKLEERKCTEERTAKRGTLYTQRNCDREKVEEEHCENNSERGLFNFVGN
jgi:hypothetical protein